jgi:hypothetical protein
LKKFEWFLPESSEATTKDGKDSEKNTKDRGNEETNAKMQK